MVAFAVLLLVLYWSGLGVWPRRVDRVKGGFVVAGQRPGNGDRGVKRDALPALSDDPILERLDAPPPVAPKPSESAHDKARRMLIAQPGQWMVLNARVKLSEATARRLARSYQRAKPARLVETATGRFAARPFVRDDVWLVAAVYESPVES